MSGQESYALSSNINKFGAIEDQYLLSPGDFPKTSQGFRPRMFSGDKARDE